MSEGARITVLVNPTSGKGRGRAITEATVSGLREAGANVHLRVGDSATTTRTHAAEAVREQPDLIVVVGGDGTLSTILEEITHSQVPIALVPAGTGNDFARALGLPYKGREATAEAVSIALRGEVRSIDVATAACPEQTVKFLTVAALGFDALVSERTNRLSWPRGAARYYIALLIELIRLRPVNFTVTINDETPRMLPGTLAAVGNTRSYGGGMPICPDAEPDDGLFDLTHVAPLTRFRLLKLFPLLLRAEHIGRAEVLARRCASIEIAAPGLVVYADGERIGTESVRISVLAGALQVLVPKGTS